MIYILYHIAITLQQAIFKQLIKFILCLKEIISYTGLTGTKTKFPSQILVQTSSTKFHKICNVVLEMKHAEEPNIPIMHSFYELFTNNE
jgi:hypothetical protein